MTVKIRIGREARGTFISDYEEHDLPLFCLLLLCLYRDSPSVHWGRRTASVFAITAQKTYSSFYATVFQHALVASRSG